MDSVMADQELTIHPSEHDKDFAESSRDDRRDDRWKPPRHHSTSQHHTRKRRNESQDHEDNGHLLKKIRWLEDCVSETRQENGYQRVEIRNLRKELEDQKKRMDELEARSSRPPPPAAPACHSASAPPPAPSRTEPTVPWYTAALAERGRNKNWNQQSAFLQDTQLFYNWWGNKVDRPPVRKSVIIGRLASQGLPLAMLDNLTHATLMEIFSLFCKILFFTLKQEKGLPAKVPQCYHNAKLDLSMCYLKLQEVDSIVWKFTKKDRDFFAKDKMNTGRGLEWLKTQPLSAWLAAHQSSATQEHPASISPPTHALASGEPVRVDHAQASVPEASMEEDSHAGMVGVTGLSSYDYSQPSPDIMPSKLNTPDDVVAVTGPSSSTCSQPSPDTISSKQQAREKNNNCRNISTFTERLSPAAEKQYSDWGWFWCQENSQYLQDAKKAKIYSSTDLRLRCKKPVATPNHDLRKVIEQRKVTKEVDKKEEVPIPSYASKAMPKGPAPVHNTIPEPVPNTIPAAELRHKMKVYVTALQTKNAPRIPGLPPKGDTGSSSLLGSRRLSPPPPPPAHRGNSSSRTQGDDDGWRTQRRR